MKCIIIVAGKITIGGTKALDSQAQKSAGITMETFKEDSLQTNITKHKSVPRHEILSNQEAQAILEKYQCKISQLPRILPKDPIVRYMGCATGQILKITRVSSTAGRYVTYRVVAERNPS